MTDLSVHVRKTVFQKPGLDKLYASAVRRLRSARSSGVSCAGVSARKLTLRFQALEATELTDARERREEVVEPESGFMAGCCSGDGAGRMMALVVDMEGLLEGLFDVRFVCRVLMVPVRRLTVEKGRRWMLRRSDCS